MSDLTATNCGCGCDAANSGCSNGCGVFGNNSFILILILIFCCGGNSLSGNGCSNGCFGDNSCLFLILLLFCCGGCGNNCF